MMALLQLLAAVAAGPSPSAGWVRGLTFAGGEHSSGDYVCQHLVTHSAAHRTPSADLAILMHCVPTCRGAKP